MPSWYHSCSYGIQEVYASPLAKSIWGEVKRGSDGQKMDHRILLSGDSAEHRNRTAFVLYYVKWKGFSFRVRIWVPDSADFDLGPTVASYLSRHIAVTASPACQCLIACLWSRFQGAGKSTLAGIVEHVDPAPSHRSKFFFWWRNVGGKS